jgi:hypothetical protein
MALTRRELVNPNCEVTDSDFEAIESAIMETSRGRWFLSEYARRNRHADTNMLLSAINKLKEIIDDNRKASRSYLVSTELSLAHLANQIEKHPAPIRNLPVVQNGAHINGAQTNGAQLNGAEARPNGKTNESDLRELMCSLEEADAFKFN